MSMRNILTCIAVAVLMLLTLPFQAVSAVTIVTPQFPFITDGGVDTPYTFSFVASGGSAPYTWKKESGILPPGLSLSTEGALSGMPTSRGSYDFTVKVTDNALTTASKQIFMNVTSMPMVMPSSHPNEYANCITCHGVPDLPPVTTFSSKPAILTASTNASFVFSANETATFQCSRDGAAMASCVSPVNFTGLGLGPHTFKVRATDTTGNVEFPPASYSWDITTSLAITTQSPLPAGTVGASYSLTLAAINGAPPLYWLEAIGKSLPAGLSLEYTTGVISGAPTAIPGSYNFTLEVFDESWQEDSKDFTILINDHPDLAITTASLTSGTVGTVYSQPLAAAGGMQGYTWSIVNGSGSLPAGLTLNTATGSISGEPSGAAGTYNFDVNVTDSHSHSATKAFSIIVYPALAISTSSLSSGTVGTPYSQTFTAVYGTPPYTWSKNGAFPTGLSLSSTGVISGTPETYGTYSPISLIVTDSNGKTANKTFNNGMVITDHPILTITTASLPSGIVGASYIQAVAAEGGVPAYNWTIYSGSLPAGLALSPTTGTISGNTTAAGIYNFRLKVSETHHHIAYKDLSIVIYPVLTITTESFPSGAVGTSYSHSPVASGGATPYTWAKSGGTIPPGLTFSAGILSGSPTTAGSYNFTLSVNDSSSQTADKSYTVVINTLLTITTASLPSGTLGTSYSQTLAASGGAIPYAWSHTSGALPPGLTFNAGVISGSPTTAGSYNFTLTVNDTTSQTASRPFTIVIDAAAPSTPPITIPGLPGTYSSLMNAYASVPANGTINIASGNLTETLDFNRSIPFSLKGGYDSASGTNPGTSTITGTLTVRSGALIIENIAIK